MSIEEEFGVLKERVRGMPTHEHLIDIRRETTSAIKEVAAELKSVLRDDKTETRGWVDDAVKRTVENAFSLLWEKVETKVATDIATKIPPPAPPPPPRRDWMPYIIVIGMIAAGLLERAWPYISRKFG